MIKYGAKKLTLVQSNNGLKKGWPVVYTFAWRTISNDEFFHTSKRKWKINYKTTLYFIAAWELDPTRSLELHLALECSNNDQLLSIFDELKVSKFQKQIFLFAFEPKNALRI